VDQRLDEVGRPLDDRGLANALLVRDAGDRRELLDGVAEPPQAERQQAQCGADVRPEAIEAVLVDERQGGGGVGATLGFATLCRLDAGEDDERERRQLSGLIGQARCLGGVHARRRPPSGAKVDLGQAGERVGQRAPGHWQNAPPGCGVRAPPARAHSPRPRLRFRRSNS
jgi:hypothetical protein